MEKKIRKFPQFLNHNVLVLVLCKPNVRGAVRSQLKVRTIPTSWNLQNLVSSHSFAVIVTNPGRLILLSSKYTPPIYATFWHTFNGGFDSPCHRVSPRRCRLSLHGTVSCSPG